MPTEKIVGVYAIVNAIDGKAYIGSSTRLPRRWKEHLIPIRVHAYKNQELRTENQMPQTGSRFSVLSSRFGNRSLKGRHGGG